MKLTDLAIDGPEIESPLSLENLHPRINVVVAPSAARRHVLTLWQRCLGVPPLAGSADSLSRGWIVGHSHTGKFRIAPDGLAGCRTAWSGQSAADAAFREPSGGPTSPQPLTSDQRVIMDRLLTIETSPEADGNAAGPLLEAIQTWIRFVGRPGDGQWRNEAEYLAWRESARSRQARLAALTGELAALEASRRQVQSRLTELGVAEESHRRGLQAQAASRDELAALQRSLDDCLRSLTTLAGDITAVEARLAALPAQVADGSALLRLAGLLERIDEVSIQLEHWHRLQDAIQELRTRVGQEARNASSTGTDSTDHPYHRAAVLIARIEALADETSAAARSRNDSSEIRFAGMPEAHEFAALVHDRSRQQRTGLHELCAELEQQYRHVRHRTSVAELRQLRHWHDQAAANVQRLSERREAMFEEAAGLDPALVAAIRPQEQQFLRWLRTDGLIGACRRAGCPVPAAGLAPSIQTESHPDRSALQQRLDDLLAQKAALTAEEQRIRDRIPALRLRLQQPVLESGLLAELASLRDRDADLGRQTVLVQNELASLRRAVEEDGIRPAWVPDPALDQASALFRQLTGETWTALAPATDRATLCAVDARGQHCPAAGLPASVRRDMRISLACAAQGVLRNRGQELPLLIELAGADLDAGGIGRLTRVIEQQGLDGHQLLLLCDRTPVLSAGSGGEPNDLLKVTVWRPETALSTARIVAWNAPGRDAPPSAPVRTLPAAGPFGRTVAGPAPDSGRFSSSLASFQTLAPSTGSLPLIETGISEETLLQNVNLCPSDLLRLFSAVRVLTIADLLDLDPEDPPVALVNASLSAADLDRIQAMAWLMVCVAGLATEEARLLVDAGIREPEELASTSGDQLLQRLHRQLASAPASHPAGLAARISRDRIQRWHRSLESSRRTWRRDGGLSRQSRRRPITRSALPSAGDGSWFARQRTTPWRAGETYFDEQGRARPSIWREPDDLAEEEPRGPEPSPHRVRTPRDEQAGLRRSADSHGHANGRHGDGPYRNGPDGGLWSSRFGNERPDTGSSRPDAGPARHRSPEPPESQVPRELSPAERESRPPREPLHSESRTATEPPASGSALRFYLNLDDPVEAAPSIGPRTAVKFEEIGIRTIRDFLRTTAESMAERINYKRISAEVIRQWQDQSRLVCRIPNLRGHDAQLLVAVGIREAEQLESVSPRQLLERIAPFADSREGLKIIRSGKKPDLAEVTDWIAWSRHTRSLSAA